MSFSYLPLFTGDYLRDTRHLSPLKHGIYLLALMHCWDSKGPLPLDEQECAGICNCRSADEVEAMRYVIDRYFVRMEDGHYNKRMAEEVAKSERLSGQFRQAGLKSAEVRREKARTGTRTKVEGRLKVGSALVEPRLVSPSPSPSSVPSNTRSEEVSGIVPSAPLPPTVPAPREFTGEEDGINPKALVRLSSEFGLPEDWGLDAERLGWKNGQILHQAEKFRQYWTVGKGSGTTRTLKGWRQCWSNWLDKAAKMEAR